MLLLASHKTDLGGEPAVLSPAVKVVGFNSNEGGYVGEN